MAEQEKAYLGLGSNVGDRLKNLALAVEKIRANARIDVLRLSSIYETEPYGFHEQPYFLNCVVEVETSLPPVGLLIVAKSVEEQLGRSSGHRWGPREIDVDILSYAQKTATLEFLRVPHRDLAARRFVLVPFSEIAPHFIPPGKKESISELLKACPDSGDVRLLGTAHLLAAHLGEEYS